ncbi:Adenosylhomocysteinase [Actinacidiphila bryophytorum]|uniref:Adenosylhomocysteinase n=1 Tax=Actinacidiphila bryophytorum TaxID=1436133 RepID=A0A9W4ECG7_9ACTN|nr:Adenosylhomocysteinase [Actinacidiphila bryophytorum]
MRGRPAAAVMGGRDSSRPHGDRAAARGTRTRPGAAGGGGGVAHRVAAADRRADPAGARHRRRRGTGAGRAGLGP